MIQSIRHYTELAFNDYKKYDRTKWVVNRCGMCVLCMDMTFWTQDSETAL